MGRIRRWPLAASFALGVLLVPGTSGAQSRTTSAVRGTITTADGVPLAGVDVVFRHEGMGVERTAVTNALGRFIITVLPPGGPYSLRATHIGYAELARTDVRLQVGETHTFELVLEEQAVAVEGVTVEVERTEVFNPSQVGPATRLDEVTLDAIPVLSRDLLDLAVLSPLVKTTEGGGFSVLGQNDRYNALLIDGIPGQDVFGLTAGGVPGGQAGAKMIPLDAVAQYEILVAPFDVRLSGFTGGVMNAVTRTGTNDWWMRVAAVHRNEALMGDLELPSGAVQASGVDRSLFALSVGGPIVRDRAHVFVATEFERRRQPPTGFNLVRDDPSLIRISPESVAGFSDVFESSFGVQTGIPGPYPLRQELGNVFARVDWNLSDRNRLTVRNVFARASNDRSPNRSPFEPYELSSNAVHNTSTNNATSLQLFSDLGRLGGNELNLEIRRSSDRSSPVSGFPQVEIDLRSSIGGASFTRGLRVGSQFFAQDNDLEQTSFRLTNSLTLARRGYSSVVLGVTGAYYRFANRFLPGADGDWFFANMDDLRLNAPQRFQRSVLAEGHDPAVEFSVLEWGGFAQYQMDAGKGLTMRFGIRADVPHVLGRPGRNPGIHEWLGHDTSKLPSGNVLISPRWGFNWQSEGRLRTQVRGGAGLFTGQLPFVWLSNAFHNDGLRSVTQVCEGRWTDEPPTGNTVPMFDPASPPETCLRGDFMNINTVVLLEEGFRYPQNFRFSAGVDQELSESVSTSLGFLFNHSFNQIVLEEQNLGDPAGQMGPLDGYGGVDRTYYGYPVERGFAPTWDNPDFAHVLVARNINRDWAFSFTGELRGRLGDRFGLQSGYTWSRSYDLMSLTFTDMVSNFGFNPTSMDPNRRSLGTSNFDRPHKVVLALYGAPLPGLEDTEFSLLYTGQSGLPFSYVYDGDLNGDGYPGRGPAFDRYNDLIYVPQEATEIPAGIGTYVLLNDALERDACLSAHRGGFMYRNACRAPWQNRLDLRMTQTMSLAGAQVRLEADVINLLNMVNGGWGRLQTIRPVVTLIEPIRRSCTTCPLVSQWSGTALPSREDDGRLVATDPWSVLSPDSQWRIQVGARVTLGGESGQR
jgi:hypothetical protein